MFPLLLLLLVLAVVVIFGHGTWLLIATVIRTIVGPPRASQAVPPAASKGSDEDAFGRVLARLRAQGLITPEQQSSLLEKLKPKTVPRAAPIVPAPPRLTVAVPRQVEDEVPLLAILCEEEQPEVASKATVVVASTPRQSWAAVIESFLAVHNIRWGELVAGLLIVVCSVGLVISLWSTLLSANRVLPALIFLSANAAIFAAGFYTLAKWKLRHTSRAVLLIATLLVPLSVLAGLATATQGRASVSLGDPSVLLTILGGIALNVFLISRSGRALFGAAKAWSFTLAVATPAALIPLVPAALRSTDGDAGYMIAMASVAVAGAVMWFQQPWRYVASPDGIPGRRRMLTAVSNHQWTFQCVAAFSLVALASTVAYMGRDLGSELWLKIIVCMIPAVTTIAVASRFTQLRSAKPTHQFIGRVVSVLATGSVMLVAVIFASEPIELWTWAVVSSACWLAGFAIYRSAPWLAIATLPLGVAALVSSTCVLQQVEWSSLSWLRRIIGGEAMLTSGVLGILGMVLAVLHRSNEHKRSLAVVAVAWFGFSSLNAAALVFAPADWLGIVPEGALVVLLVLFTIASAIAAVTIGVPAGITVGLAILVALGVFQPVMLVGDAPIAAADVWARSLLLAAGILTTLGMVIRRATLPSIQSMSRRLGIAVMPQRVVLSGNQWHLASAALASLAVLVATTQFSDEAMFVAISATAASVVLLISGSHLRARVWLVASQLSSLVVAASVARHFFSAAFYPAWNSFTGNPVVAAAGSSQLVWNWALLLAVLGGVWIAIEAYHRRGWFPLAGTTDDAILTDAPMSAATQRHFPICWFVAIASGFLALGSVLEFSTVVTRNVGAGLPYWLVPVAGFALAIAANYWLARSSAAGLKAFWRQTLTLVQVSLVLWVASVSPVCGLLLFGVIGGMIAVRLSAESRSPLDDIRTRAAAWLVVIAGAWSIWQLTSPGHDWETFWTALVGWSAGWSIVWSLVPSRLAIRAASSPLGPTTSPDEKAYWAELLVMVVGISVVEIFAQSAAVIEPRSWSPSPMMFCVRFAVIEILALAMWLRAKNELALGTSVTVAVVWLAAASLAMGSTLDWPDANAFMIATLVGCFASAMSAMSLTPLSRSHDAIKQGWGMGRGMDVSSHSLAVLSSLLVSVAATMLVALWMLFAAAPLITIQLTVGGIVIVAIGVSEVSERLGRDPVRRLALGLGLIAIYAWAGVMTPFGDVRVLAIAMRWLMLSVWLIPAIVWGLPRLTGEAWARRWRVVLHQTVTVVAGVGAVSLLAMLTLEAGLKFTGEMPMLPIPLVAGVALSIGSLSVLAAIVALASGPTLGASLSVPRAMKLTIADSHRSWLVIAAQVIGVLTWMHVYFCKPQFALMGLRAYWPYIVMALAFASVGVVEWVRRRGDTLIATTLSQTSLYLPLIPVLGVLISGAWIEPVSGWMSGGPSLTIVLMVAAGYYLFVSRVWEGWMPRVMMVVLANSAIWSLLVNQPQWSFLAHPQLWLIPPAACALVLAQRYRGEMDAKLVSAIRYGATLVIYISSTADMMLQHIGTTLWGPVVLILLALAGMAAGVVLRVRPFLYLGTVFVMLGVMSMVWHAQRSIDQVWPWWVFGITTGVCLLAGLMSLEKNKGKLQEFSARLKAWEA